MRLSIVGKELSDLPGLLTRIATDCAAFGNPFASVDPDGWRAGTFGINYNRDSGRVEIFAINESEGHSA